MQIEYKINNITYLLACFFLHAKIVIRMTNTTKAKMADIVPAITRTKKDVPMETFCIEECDGVNKTFVELDHVATVLCESEKQQFIHQSN